MLEYLCIGALIYKYLTGIKLQFIIKLIRIEYYKLVIIKLLTLIEFILATKQYWCVFSRHKHFKIKQY